MITLSSAFVESLSALPLSPNNARMPAASSAIVAITATGHTAPTAAAETSWATNWFSAGSSPIRPLGAILSPGGVTRRHPGGVIPTTRLRITRTG